MYRNDHDILPNEVVYVGEERSYNFSLNFLNISRTMLVVMMDYYNGEKKPYFHLKSTVDFYILKCIIIVEDKKQIFSPLLYVLPNFLYFSFS